MIGVQLNDWATAQIEQCAGRVPLIVGGYPDGWYHPEYQCTRDQMAVYISRAIADPVGEEGLEGYTGPATATSGGRADVSLRIKLRSSARFAVSSNLSSAGVITLEPSAAAR